MLDRRKAGIEAGLGSGDEAGERYTKDLLTILGLTRHLNLVVDNLGGQAIGDLRHPQVFRKFRSDLGGIAVDGLLTTEDHVKLAFDLLELLDRTEENIAGRQRIRPSKPASRDQIGLVTANG